MRAFRRVGVALAALLTVGSAAAVHGSAAHATSAANDGSASIVRAGIKLIHPPAHSAQRVQSPLTLQSSAVQGTVSQHPKVYLVFWGSQWSSDPAGVKPALQNFFQGLFGATDTWGTVMNQYCSGLAVGTVNCGAAGNHIIHPTSTIFGGAWTDNAAAAPTNATAAQIAAEAVKGAQHFGNTTQTPNLDAQYVIASATGTHPDGFPSSGFCAWHSSTTNAAVGGTIAYTNMPYMPDTGAGGCTTIANPTLLDGYFSTETHEYAETITDFWPSIGWVDDGGAEIGDKCQDLDARLTLSTGTFDMQGIWSNSDNACLTHSGGGGGGPANDNFANRQTLNGDSGTTTEPTTGASKEPGEPSHAGDAGGASVWYSYTAPFTGTLTLDTCASNFDTLLGVYTGSAVNALTEVVSNDDNAAVCGANALQSSVSFPTTAGTVYKIAVDGYHGATGSLSLHWNWALNISVPYSANDAARIQQMATFLGTTPTVLQHDAVKFLGFLETLSGDTTPTPWTPTPIGNAVTFTSSWSSADVPTLNMVKAKYVVTAVDAHRLGISFLSFLLALGGH